uniref:Ig-like domain-containing protein n=1 Tax=Oryzias latipes TaxID=8090 RepID=A0A3P9LIM5_ORYLA
MQRCLQMLLTCLLLVTPVRDLVAPPSTVVMVRVGTEAVLPCHLGQGVNSSTLRMEWMRSDLSRNFVFVWVEGRERLEHKLWSYLQRTSVLFSGMKLGDVSLQLTNVTALDEGTYICRAPRLRQSCSVQLLAFASSPPAVSVVREVENTAELWCESAGWHPKPDVSWLDETGEPLPAERVETLRDADGLFRVSSRVRVDKTRSNSATCRLQTQSIAQSRETFVYIRVLSWYMYVILGVGFIGTCVAAGFLVYSFRLRDDSSFGKDAEPETNAPTDQELQTEQEVQV